MTELRQRTKQQLPLDSIKLLPSTSSSISNPPIIPPPLDRTSSSSSTTTTNSSAGDQTPSKYNDDLFSGLALLDLLVLLDAHLELWSRGIRKTSKDWKEKANAVVEDGKNRAIKLQKVHLPRLKSEVFLSNLGLGSTSDIGGDRERLEKKYKEIRLKTSESMKKLSQKWEEEKTVRLRDKLSFVYGVHNVLMSAILLGFYPTWIPFYYTVQVLAYLPLRVYTYKKKSFHYFLFDACYYVNLLCLVYLWILPSNPYLFEACYGLSLGTLGTAIATWRNSLVFHDLDKVISLVIHIFPPFVFTTLRHYYPQANLRYPALDYLPHLKPWRSMAISMMAYLIWQLGYYRWVIVARKAKIQAGRATSFTYLINDKKGSIGKIASKVPEEWREGAFMLGQAVYTFVTLLIPVFVLYDSKFWSTVYLLTLFAVSAWNGASFYLDVFARKFEKELVTLRKEFEEQQHQLHLLMTLNKSNSTTTTSSNSTSTTTENFDLPDNSDHSRTSTDDSLHTTLESQQQQEREGGIEMSRSGSNNTNNTSGEEGEGDGFISRNGSVTSSGTDDGILVEEEITEDEEEVEAIISLGEEKREEKDETLSMSGKK